LKKKGESLNVISRTLEKGSISINFKKFSSECKEYKTNKTCHYCNKLGHAYIEVKRRRRNFSPTGRGCYSWNKFW